MSFYSFYYVQFFSLYVFQVTGNIWKPLIIHPALGLGRKAQPGNVAFGLSAFSGDAGLRCEP